MLIAAHDALKSAADSEADNKIPEVDKKFQVAIDLLYHFVNDFPKLNPSIRDARFTQLIDEGDMLPWYLRPPFTELCSLRRSIRAYVEFSSNF